MTDEPCRMCRCRKRRFYNGTMTKSYGEIDCSLYVECPEMVFGVRPKRPACHFAYQHDQCCGTEICTDLLPSSDVRVKTTCRYRSKTYLVSRFWWIWVWITRWILQRSLIFKITRWQNSYHINNVLNLNNFSLVWWSYLPKREQLYEVHLRWRLEWTWPCLLKGMSTSKVYHISSREHSSEMHTSLSNWWLLSDWLYLP